MSAPVVRISRRGADRIRAGHPWIYRSDIAASDAAPGDLVSVVADTRRLGWAFWSSASKIALRMISTDGRRPEPDGRVLFAARIREAIDYRATLDIDATAYRLVSADADGLPGVVVDRYADETGIYLVVQTLSQGADRRLGLLVDVLVELVAPKGILARNDPKVRRLEGLDERVEVVYGDIPDRVVIREGTVRLQADLKHGQKTGAFLDQRENHLAAARYVRGRALDGFTYHGGFALQMAGRAESVLALDSSAAAVATARENVRANGFDNVDVREANVFDELREIETTGAKFDTIVLDPPAFAKNRTAVESALAGYKEINLRALRLLVQGGCLITCSCSFNVSEALFIGVVLEAANDARANVVLAEKRMQARDHPVLLGLPESYYLKCLVLRRI